MSLLNEFTKGLWKDLAPFRVVLGLCPILAVTLSATTAIFMGVAVIFVLTCSNITVSALRNVIPRQIRIASYIVIIASFVTIVELFSQAFFFPIYMKIASYIKLIVVNCIILGRAEAFASKNGVMASAFDALGISIGFTMSLIVLGSIREILGAGTLFGIDIMYASFRPFDFMVQPPGAFLSLGLLLAIINAVSKTSRS